MAEFKIRHLRYSMCRQMCLNPACVPRVKFKKFSKPGRYVLTCLSLFLIGGFDYCANPHPVFFSVPLVACYLMHGGNLGPFYIQRGLLSVLSLNALGAIFALLSIQSFFVIWWGYGVVMPKIYGRRQHYSDFKKGRRPSPQPKGDTPSLVPYVLYVAVVFWCTLWSLRGHATLLWSNNLNVSNGAYSAMLFLGLFSLITLWALALLSKSASLPVHGEYVLSIGQLALYLPPLALANTALSFFFFLEVASTLVMYNLVSTRAMLGSKRPGHWAAPSSGLSKYFFNLMFFHYWAAFFGTTLLLFGIINLSLIFGTTEWSQMGFLLRSTLSFSTTNPMTVILAVVPFLVGFWIKLGLAPFFIYKVEVYKGLPLYTVVFYSLMYFAYFVGALLFFTNYYFGSALALVRPVLLLASLLALSVVIFLFDTQSIRNFFALSSVLMATNFFVALTA